MRNIIGQAVLGDDLYGRDYELDRLWENLEQGEHILMLAPRRVGKTSLMLEVPSRSSGELGESSMSRRRRRPALLTASPRYWRSWRLIQVSNPFRSDSLLEGGQGRSPWSKCRYPDPCTTRRTQTGDWK